MQQWQAKLLSELPNNLRGQVIAHTHGEIVRKLRFFDNKPQDFIMVMLPVLTQMKVYQKDILYGQGDQSEEIFFIVKGRVKFYVNLYFNCPELELQNEGEIDDKLTHMPFNMHVEGSYFGDNDVLS